MKQVVYQSEKDCVAFQLYGKKDAEGLLGMVTFAPKDSKSKEPSMAIQIHGTKEAPVPVIDYLDYGGKQLVRTITHVEEGSLLHKETRTLETHADPNAPSHVLAMALKLSGDATVDFRKVFGDVK
jgi:hypothetical protein